MSRFATSLTSHAYDGSLSDSAGNYIPLIMDVADTHGGLPNLKGAAIGNGCNGNGVGLCSGASAYEQRIDAEVFSGHGMISLNLYRSIGKTCPTVQDGYAAQPSNDCLELYSAMHNETGGFDVYSQYYRPCIALVQSSLANFQSC